MSKTQTAFKKDALDEKVRPHQPGQTAFKAVVAEDIEWKPFAALPPSVRLASVKAIEARNGVARAGAA